VAILKSAIHIQESVMLPRSKCPHCKGQTFCVEVLQPEGARQELLFVSCATCGAPLGVTDYNNAGAKEDHENLLKKTDNPPPGVEHPHKRK
jgi:hypothetical protein